MCQASGSLSWPRWAGRFGPQRDRCRWCGKYEAVGDGRVASGTASPQPHPRSARHCTSSHKHAWGVAEETNQPQPDPARTSRVVCEVVLAAAFPSPLPFPQPGSSASFPAVSDFVLPRSLPTSSSLVIRTSYDLDHRPGQGSRPPSCTSTSLLYVERRTCGSEL